MPTIVSTGQITIIDSNDAKPITGFITASGTTQQVYSVDKADPFFPNFTSAPLTLTANLYAGSTVAETTNFAVTKWSAGSLGGASLGTAKTLVINTNQNILTPSTTYFCQGTYTDPVTAYVTTVILQIQLNILATGSNAVYVVVGGIDVIKPSNSSAKNSAYLHATLYRGSNEDAVVARYHWYKLLAGVWQKIHVGNTALSVGANLVASLYGFKLQADYVTTPTVAPAIGTNVQPTSADDAILRRGITISELAVDDFGLFKVVVVDGADTFERTFTVYDVSDPYDVNLVATKGDKLTNGQGDTDIFPTVYNGGARVSNLTGWTFTWTFRDEDGKQAAIIDRSLTAGAGGLPIGSNTATTITLSLLVANANFAANKIIKVVKGSNVAYYDLASANHVAPLAPVLTLKTTPVGIATYAPPTVNQFQGGVAFLCNFAPVTNGGATETAAALNINAADIDVKGTVYCEASRP